ncbi:MAG: DUF6788 family protein [Pseudomonadota bacterium]
MEQRIEGIKGKLALIGEMRPGSLNQQLTVCGQSNCRCKDPRRPKKHGPYYQLSYVHQGKSTTQFIQKELVGAVRSQLANYKNFKALTTEWVDIALTLAKEKLRADKERHKSEVRALRQKRPAVSGTRSRTMMK